MPGWVAGCPLVVVLFVGFAVGSRLEFRLFYDIFSLLV